MGSKYDDVADFLANRRRFLSTHDNSESVTSCLLIIDIDITEYIYIYMLLIDIKQV